ncbi:MAG: AbrB/MazE/SpoVT family DNA-binding domain-containing protein [Myxococcota bacterium]
MRITSKGQVTIPQDIREDLGLLPGTEVDFVVDGATVRIVKGAASAETRGERLVRHLRGKAGGAMSTDEIMALTRGSE